MRKELLAIRLGVSLESAEHVGPTTTLEEDLVALESVVVALEAAQTNPAAAAILFGPSMGLEDGFGAKVVAGAKKLWEALVEFVKRLFGWGKSTKEGVKEVGLLLKDAAKKEVEVTDEQKSQQSKAADIIKNAADVSDISQKVDDNSEELNQLNKAKLTRLAAAHRKYYGHHFYDVNVDKIFSDVEYAIKKYQTNGDIPETSQELFSALDDAFKGEIPSGIIKVSEYLSKLTVLVKEYNVSKKPFSVNDFDFVTDVNVLKSEYDELFKTVSAWDTYVETIKSQMYKNESNTMTGEVVGMYRFAFTIVKVLTDFLNIKLDYLRAALDYRSDFEK